MAKREREPTQIDDELLAASTPEGWEDDDKSGGFPPYWNPQLGKSFQGIIVKRDERDPDFIRYIIQATDTIMCATGPASDAEEVIVEPGQLFTCSAYATMNLEEYFGLEVKVITWKTRTLPGKESSRGVPRSLWEFKYKLPPDSKRLLDTMRKAESDNLRKRVFEARMISLSTNSKSEPKKVASKSTNTDDPPF